MTIVDHLYTLIFAVAYPAADYFYFQKLLRRVEAGETISPTYLYNITLRGHWLLFVVGIVIWIASKRSWAALGFGFELDTGFLVGAALTVAAIAFLVLQLQRLAEGNAKDIESLRRQVARFEIIFPRSANELNRFYALSITAGIVEETLWRGFLFWYLGQFMPLWGAAIVSAIGFGLAHAYQGARNIPQVTLAGGVFAVLYLITGTLWLPILLHAIGDIVQGRGIYGVLRNGGTKAATKEM